MYGGIQIFNLIRDYKRDNPNARITITLKGLAASMASYIAAVPVADMVVAEDNAVLMVHNPWAVAAGDFLEMRKTADVLDGLAQLMGQAYAARTGKSVEDMRAVMNSETWFFGEEMKAAGYVDEIIASEDGQQKDKAAALSAAKLRFLACADKMKTSGGTKESLSRIAAVIQGSEGFPAGSAAAASGIVSASALAQARAEIAAEIERQRIPALIALKRELRSSPLYQGLNSILEESITGEKSLVATLTDMLKWSVSGGLAALESPGALNAGHSIHASGEVPGPIEDYHGKWK